MYFINVCVQEIDFGSPHILTRVITQQKSNNINLSQINQ